MANPSFHTLTVTDIKQETKSCVSVAFAIPSELKNEFAYEAGQYITIKKEINGEEVRRSYSLCSSPLETDFRVAIKLIRGGKFSSYANHDLKIDDKLEVMTPMGNFTTQLDAKHSKQYMAFAAGSGITPMMSLIKSVLASEPNSSFTLVYGNQNFYSIIFREELEALKNKYLGRFQIVHLLSRERMETELNYGRINADKCQQLFDKLIDVNTIDQFFLCGPEDMIMSVKSYLESNQVNTDKIHFELFTSDSSTKAKVAFQEAHKEDLGKVSMVTIKVDDRSFEIPLAYGGDTILDAALKHGADLPFACKGGVCCTCRAKVTEGTVEMEVNYALEKDEVANGFVLSCQAHPTSERVVIDFDAR
jgi:ring-1,2-phenylacetyl-CoA epoxidase subunit PaaE